MSQADFPIEVYNTEQQYFTHNGTFHLTFRETDILACLLGHQNRKKIAAILDIKVRTVDTYIFNLTQKFGKHSCILLIECIKQSKQAPELFTRYLRLLSAYEFKVALHTLKNHIKTQGVVCKIICDDTTLKHRVCSDLEILGVTCFDRKKDIQEVRIGLMNNYYQDFFKILSELAPLPIVFEVIEQFTARCLIQPYIGVSKILHDSFDKTRKKWLWLEWFKLWRFWVVFSLVFLFFLVTSLGVFNVWTKKVTVGSSIRSDLCVPIESRSLYRKKIHDQITVCFQDHEPIKIVAW